MRTSIAPMLSVRGGKAAVAFYREAFGASEELRLEGADGSLVARMSIEGAEFWVADEAPEYANYSPQALGGSTVRIILAVADPDALFARAVAAGATAVTRMEDHDYGWRDGRVADPFGHHWEIGRPIEG